MSPMCNQRAANENAATSLGGPPLAGSEMRLPAYVCDQVQTYACTHGIEVAAALRYLIEAGLAAEARAMVEAEAVYRQAR